MDTNKDLHQTYLKGCNCSNGGIILHEGKAVCRWCLTPYGKGGCISYPPESFKKPEPELKPLPEKEYVEISYRKIQGKNITPESTFMFIPIEIFEETKAAISDVFIKHYPTPLPENQPKEQDTKVGWEILSFKYPQTGAILKVVNNDAWAYLKSPTEYSIHSVRRTSDNEVFTVGDKVLYRLEGWDDTYFKIKTFEIWSNEIAVIGDDNSPKCKLSSLIKPTSPEPTNEKTVTNNDDVACLSLNDIRSWWTFNNERGTFCNFTELVNIVNQKLKQ